EGGDPAYLAAEPSFTPGIPLNRVVVRPAAADDAHVVSPTRQRDGEIAGVLRRSDDVRVERLIEEKDLQGSRSSYLTPAPTVAWLVSSEATSASFLTRN